MVAEVDRSTILFFILPEGRAYSRRFVRVSVRLVCLSASFLSNNWLELNEILWEHLLPIGDAHVVGAFGLIIFQSYVPLITESSIHITICVRAIFQQLLAGTK